MSLAGIVGHGGENLIVIACPTTLAGLQVLVLLEQVRGKFEGEVALGVGHNGGILQVLAIVVAHAPPPP